MTLIQTMEYVFKSCRESLLTSLCQDEDWAEEEQGNKNDEFAFLSDMLGPRGMAFDNDEILDDNSDEDLKNDPISQMDMQVSVAPL